ncbi:MAG: FHA domain-containing protein [Ardenticatenales bacterium]|nr:FHA domain-containing protein [Ardenticatenales bacterium]
MEIERAMLILEEGLSEPHRWLVEKEVTTLGRWPDNDIILPDRLVSRHHAHIRRDGSQFMLVDCQSTNGTFVNGSRIGQNYALQDGDCIQIAPHFQLRFVDSASTAPAPNLHRPLRLRVEQEECQVLVGEDIVDLSVAQYTLLCYLMKNEGRVVSRPEIVREVWAEEEAIGITNQAIDALIRRLRERLTEIDPDHQYVQTVRGHGFKFENRR